MKVPDLAAASVNMISREGSVTIPEKDRGLPNSDYSPSLSQALVKQEDAF